MTELIAADTANTENVSSLSLATGDYYSFNHGSAWSPANPGTYAIDIWASNINGSTDMNTTNDTVSASVTVYANGTNMCMPGFVLYTNIQGSEASSLQAGTYSDGKLYTRSKKRGDNIRVLELLCFDWELFRGESFGIVFLLGRKSRKLIFQTKKLAASCHHC